MFRIRPIKPGTRTSYGQDLDILITRIHLNLFICKLSKATPKYVISSKKTLKLFRLVSPKLQIMKKRHTRRVNMKSRSLATAA